MSSAPIDLRSDTVTRPTPGMLDAMMRAEVGDDVWNEDPTVSALEAAAAARFGKAAAVFCPSGTMTNQIAIVVHTRPGDEVICSAESHIYNYEGGGIAATAGASARLLGQANRGRFTASEVERSILPDDPHCPRSRLVAVEDTVNRGGGAIWSRDALLEISALCRARGLRYHLDGARVFNRLVAAGDDPVEYGAAFDSISICLSKGLGAPVGSVLIGDEAFVAQARRVRKRLGGGMRQAGFLAAAGLYALEHHVERLTEDHAGAARLAEAAGEAEWAQEVLPQETNIVICRTRAGLAGQRVVEALEADGVRAATMAADLVRFVTHLDVDEQGLERAARVVRELRV